MAYIPAPREPYQPVPEESLQQIGTRPIREDTPFAAFGGATAEALSQLGQTVEHSSTEMFNRAVALQQLDNETERQNADAQYLIKGGEIYANFRALQGKAAVDAYPKYVSDLEDLRQNIRGGLSNPESQRLFDSSSLSTMGRTIMYGSTHMAAENKSYLIGSAQARVGISADNALAHPADEGAFQSEIANTKQQVASLGAMQGWGQDKTDFETSKAVSNVALKRIEGMAKTNPFGAEQLMKKYVADGTIRGEQQEAVRNFVLGQSRTVGARNISHTINTGSDLYWGSKIVTPEMARDAIGKYESGNNYSQIGPETKHGRALGKYQVMEQFLPDYLARAGLPSMTPQEFLANHQAQEQVFQASFIADMNKYGSFNEAASRWFTGLPVAQGMNAPADANNTHLSDYLRATNAILAHGAPLADKVNRATEVAREQAPDDPLMEDYARGRVETDNAQFHRIKLTEDFQNRQVIEEALMGGQSGKLPTNLDELKAALPQADQAWSQLDPSVQRRYLGVLAKNVKGNVAWTEAGLTRYQALKGLAQNDPMQFLQTSMIDEDKLPFSARRELINLQGRLSAKAEADPRVTHALQILKPDLDAAGITRSEDQDRYDQFTGVLQEELQAFQEQHKRPPRMAEIQEMGHRLMATHSSGWFGLNSTANFEAPVPDEEKAQITQFLQNREGVPPTDQQIQRFYAAVLYQRLYGQKQGTQSGAK